MIFSPSWTDAPSRLVDGDCSSQNKSNPVTHSLLYNKVDNFTKSFNPEPAQRAPTCHNAMFKAAKISYFWFETGNMPPFKGAQFFLSYSDGKAPS